jgi:hypothetical protein
MKKIFGLILLSILAIVLSACEPQVVEVIKEVEVTREVEVPVEVIKEVEVTREVEVPVEVIKEVEVTPTVQPFGSISPVEEWDQRQGEEPAIPWDEFSYVVCYIPEGLGSLTQIYIISNPSDGLMFSRLSGFCAGYEEPLDSRYWEQNALGEAQEQGISPGGDEIMLFVLSLVPIP